MIDTVVLNVPNSKCKVRSTDKWDLSAKLGLFSKFIKNPSNELKKNGKYYPRLTGIKRLGQETMIKIEFSIPKLLYLNNLDEVEDKDFGLVIQVLHQRLIEMGLLISIMDLRNASVSAVHYSKNIELSDGYTSKYIISELQKINLNKAIDLTKTRFMNNGESLQGYAISNSFVFYDKVSDLAKDKKRAIDKDQTPYQQSLFDAIKQTEILRFEVRLSQKRKLNSLFEDFGYTKNPLFSDVFSESKAVKVMAYYWDEKIDKAKYILFTSSQNTESLLKQIAIARPKSKGKSWLYLLGLVSFVKDNKGGLRELRSILSSKIVDRTWYGIVKDLKLLSRDLEGISNLDWYGSISKQIRAYKPYKSNISM